MTDINTPLGNIAVKYVGREVVDLTSSKTGSGSFAEVPKHARITMNKPRVTFTTDIAGHIWVYEFKTYRNTQVEMLDEQTYFGSSTITNHCNTSLANDVVTTRSSPSNDTIFYRRTTDDWETHELLSFTSRFSLCPHGMSADGNVVVGAASDNNIQAHEYSGGSLLAGNSVQVVAGTNQIRGIEVSGDGTRLVVGHLNGTSRRLKTYSLSGNTIGSQIANKVVFSSFDGYSQGEFGLTHDGSQMFGICQGGDTLGYTLTGTTESTSSWDSIMVDGGTGSVYDSQFGYDYFLPKGATNSIPIISYKSGTGFYYIIYPTPTPEDTFDCDFDNMVMHGKIDENDLTYGTLNPIWVKPYSFSEVIVCYYDFALSTNVLRKVSYTPLSNGFELEEL